MLLFGDWLELCLSDGEGHCKRDSLQILNLQGFVSLEKLEFLISMSIFLIILLGYFRDIGCGCAAMSLESPTPFQTNFFGPIFSLHCRGTRSTGIPRLK